MKISKTIPAACAIAVLIALAVVPTAHAAAPAARPGPAMGGMRGFIQTLSAEQRAAIQKLVVEQEKKAIALRAELKTKELDLYTLVTGDAAQAKVYAALEEIGTLRTNLEKLRMDLRLAIRKQLTPEQKAKFDQGFLMRFLRPGGRGQQNRPGPVAPEHTPEP